MGVAIARDRAWEHHIHFQVSVVDDGGVAKLWYASPDQGAGKLKSLGYFGYAESTDGVHWTKPELGVVAFNGSLRNNLTTPRIKRANVFIDPTAPPERKFTAFGRNMDDELGPKGYGVMTSADGIHFARAITNGAWPAGDTQNMAFWDHRIGRYVAYVRGFVESSDGNKRRAVARWETNDLTSRAGWNLENNRSATHVYDQLPIVLACDADDPPLLDIYTPSVAKYPGADDVYIATPSMYHHFTPEEAIHADPPRNDGLVDIQLAVSRDGIAWSRPDRRSYVGLESDPPAISQVYGSVGMIVRGDKVYQYHVAYEQTHGVRRTNTPGGQIRWTEQRLDGFTAIESAYAGGEIITKPFIASGSRLELNIDVAAAGEARVEIQDERGVPLPGHALADSDRILGNRVRAIASWHGAQRVKLPVGAPIRLRVASRNTKLFAVQFAESHDGTRVSRDPGN